MNRPRNLTEQAFIHYFESIDPRQDLNSAAELEQVRKSIAENGIWEEQEEWRISTYFDSRIEEEEIKGKVWFKVRVECDTQEFSCRCPSIEKAFMFSKLYRHLIVYQFYSVGPPWA